jgi:hypothetical protein
MMTGEVLQSHVAGTELQTGDDPYLWLENISSERSLAVSALDFANSSIVVIRAYRASEGFLFRLVAFIREQFKLSAPRAFSFLAADLRNLLLCGGAGSC